MKGPNDAIFRLVGQDPLEYLVLGTFSVSPPNIGLRWIPLAFQHEEAWSVRFQGFVTDEDKEIAYLIIADVSGDDTEPTIKRGNPTRFIHQWQRCKGRPVQRGHSSRAHPLIIHLQDLDFRARQIHPKSDPPDAGTKNLAAKNTRPI